MKIAPIVLSVYNRPEHAKKTLESLKNNKMADESILFIYADGPKDKGKDMVKVREVRKFIREKKWCKEVHIIESDKNKGLADSTISGVTEIVSKYKKAIIIEDDLLLSKGFLKYMNDALNFYEKEEKVMHIASHIPPVKEKLPETFFFGQASSWGWGTWERAWKNFNPDSEELLKKLRETNNINKFNIDGSYDFLSHLLANVYGCIYTWAIKWQASIFLKEGLCLHPGSSLVQNIGFDNNATHLELNNIYIHTALADEIKVKPIPLKECKKSRKIIAEYYEEHLCKGIVNKIKGSAKRTKIGWLLYKNISKYL